MIAALGFLLSLGMDTVTAAPPVDAGPIDAPPAAPVDAVALIWGGGKTEAEARASLVDFDRRARAWFDRDELAWREGFPRVVASADVQGLNPGFQIVLLGVCAAGAAHDVVKVLDALEPAFYAKRVRWPAAAQELPCPGPAQTWEPGFADEFSVDGVAEVRSGASTLTAVVIGHREAGSELEELHWKLLASVHTRAASESLVVEDGERFSRVESLGPAPGRPGTLRLRVMHVPSPCWGSREGEQYAATYDLVVKDGKPQVERRDGKRVPIDCGPNPWEVTARPDE